MTPLIEDEFAVWAIETMRLERFWCQVAITALIQVGTDDDWNFAGETVSKKEVFMLLCRRGR